MKKLLAICIVALLHACTLVIIYHGIRFLGCHTLYQCQLVPVLQTPFFKIHVALGTAFQLLLVLIAFITMLQLFAKKQPVKNTNDVHGTQPLQKDNALITLKVLVVLGLVVYVINLLVGTMYAKYGWGFYGGNDPIAIKSYIIFLYFTVLMIVTLIIKKRHTLVYFLLFTGTVLYTVLWHLMIFHTQTLHTYGRF